MDIINGFRNALADLAKLLRSDNEKTVASLKDATTAIKSIPDPIVRAVQKVSMGGVEARLEKLIGVINNKDNAVSMENVDVITSELRSGLSAVIDTLREEIGKMDKQIVVKNDLGQMLSLFKGNKDKGDVLKALARVEDAIENIEFPKMVDYTSALKDLSKAVDSKTTKKLEDLLTAISKKDFPEDMRVVLEPRLIDDNRVRVVLRDDQVAKIGSVVTQGGSGSPAIIEALTRKYALRLIEDGVYTYIGKAVPGTSESDSLWQIFRMDSTTGLDIEWAEGNSAFDNAWSDYSTISYS